MKKKRSVFFISDGTGITAQNLGESLLTQFEGFDFSTITIPYVNSNEGAEEASQKITQAFQETGEQPLVFATLVNDEHHHIIKKAPCLLLDFFQTFIQPLEEALQERSSHQIGKTHGVSNVHEYMHRMNAINYAIKNDDGMHFNEFDQADVIIIGVSRSGKTPSCLYLAMKYGLYAANYPLTLEDMARDELPKKLLAHKDKIFGFDIEPQRLQQIRSERKAGSHYASLETCKKETAFARELYQKYQLPSLNTTTRSVEEIAVEIMNRLSLSQK